MNFKQWTKNGDAQNFFESFFNLYKTQFEPTNQSVIENLYSKINYIDNNKYISYINIFYEKYKSEINKNAILLASYYDNKIHNSTELYTKLKQLYNISTHINDTNIVKNKKIIILEDYSGSGKTMLDSLKYYIRKFKNMNNIHNIDIILYILIITKTAKIYIDRFINKATNILKNNGINIKLDYSEVKNDHFLSLNCLNDSDKIINLSKNKGIKNIYGYKNIEDLISFYYFTPNNTIGLLWESNNKYISFFDRNQYLNDFASHSFITKIQKFLDSIIFYKHNKNKKYFENLILIYLNFDCSFCTNFLNITDNEYSKYYHSYKSNHYLNDDNDFGSNIEKIFNPQQIEKLKAVKYLGNFDFDTKKKSIKLNNLIKF